MAITSETYDQLKIDKSFVQDLLTKPGDATVARSVVAIISAHLCLIAWNCPIGRPNWRRSCACLSVRASTASNAPAIWAQRIAANPPQVLRWTKQLLQQARTGTLDEALDAAAQLQGLAHHTADHHEAVAAFFEKRPPVFRG